MNKRLELHKILCKILGSKNVYYQPPESVKMAYPAVVYSKANIDNTFADNSVYKQLTQYEITVIDKNPDSETVYKLSQLENCRYNRHFINDNLNHDVFLLYY